MQTSNMSSITTTKLKPNEKPTKEQLKRIEQAAKKPIVSDKDSPVYTLEQLVHLSIKKSPLAPYFP